MNEEVVSDGYGSATITFPNGYIMVIDNVRVTALGGSEFRVSGHANVKDPLRPPAHLYDSQGNEIPLPERWYVCSEFLRPPYSHFRY